MIRRFLIEFEQFLCDTGTTWLFILCTIISILLIIGECLT